MAALSDYAENKLLDVLLGENEIVFPDIDNTYVALFTTETSDTGAGTEVSGTGYARKVFGNNTSDSTWASAVAGVKKNTAVVTFATAGGVWGEVTHVGIFTELVGGELLVHGALSTPKTIGDGDIFSFGIGDLQITLD